MNHAIVSVSFGAYYEPYKQRLARSVATFAPNTPFLSHDCVKPGWLPHGVAPYAFKIGAVRDAQAAGYDTVLWLDAGSYLVGPLDVLWHRIVANGHYIVADSELLANWISDEAIDHFGIARGDLRDSGWPLVGGKVYGFNLNHSRTLTFIDEWEKRAKAGLFREQSVAYRERVYGHRHDESIAAILAQHLGMSLSPFGDLYCGHQKPPPAGACVASGYDGCI